MIKYLASLEATEVLKVILALKYEDAIEEEVEFGVATKSDQIELTCLVQDNSMNNQNKPVSEIVFFLQESLQQLVKHLPLLHIFLATYEHDKNFKLGRKGSYFKLLVNGFV